MDIRLTILNELNKGPASAWSLAKKINSSDQLVRYYLKNLLFHKVISKQQKKYFLNKNNVFLFDGMAVMQIGKGLVFWGCPYHTVCPCLNIIDENCRLLKELPKPIRELVE